MGNFIKLKQASWHSILCLGLACSMYISAIDVAAQTKGYESSNSDKSGRTVTYAWAASMATDQRGQYPIRLLQLALAKSGQHYTAVPSKHDMPQWRTLRHVQMNKGLDVVWTFTDKEREKQLLPIRIPIDRGLLGWRLLLINRSDSDTFDQIETSDQLKTMRSGQGHDWPDYPILLANHFKVSPSSSYDGLFAMLKQRRIAYFPRSITEIDEEIRQRPDKDFAVAPKWVLNYPAPLYYFVSKDRPELAAAIEIGLLAAIRDGSMRSLFHAHFGDILDKAQLSKRQVVTLVNPDLPKETPLDQKQLWFSVSNGF